MDRDVLYDDNNRNWALEYRCVHDGYSTKLGKEEKTNSIIEHGGNYDDIQVSPVVIDAFWRNKCLFIETNVFGVGVLGTAICI